MLYYFTVEGICRSAIYVKDNDKRKSYCEAKPEVAPGHENDMNDCLKVTVTNSANNDQLREAWMVMHGTPREIVAHIDEEWPMAKLESEMIFDYLDTVDAEDVVTFTYLLALPDERIQKSQMYHEARVMQQLIVAHLFGLKATDVKVLDRVAF